MNKTNKKILYLAPRALAILLVIFWAWLVFASHGISATAAVESITWITILAAAIIAWKWEKIGAAIFITLGVLYIALSWGKATWLAGLFRSGPLILTGILFIASALMRKRR